MVWMMGSTPLESDSSRVMILARALDIVQLFGRKRAVECLLG
jgi:hypothetical protein